MAKSTQIIEQHVPKAKLVGKARLKVLFWNVYDSELYAQDGVWTPDQPFALSLQYLRDLQGRDIAKRSIEEMRKQGFSDEVAMTRWHDTLLNIIPNVSNNSTVVGIQDANKSTILYHNDNLLGEVSEPLFTEWFFNIWLGEKTSQPALRRQLLGA
ncbi:chalcone isomerase family protein [Glaciecola sp. SC05]|uniref:chalcone isomerase family protein n=1 Tax=Glaciecola sp. SC05 TaxID=1987355 RepID=UPI003527098D